MLKNVSAVASGKTILLGEHAVVYGRPAIAIPVTHIQAQATLRPNQSELRIIASDLNRNYLLHEAEANDPLAKIIYLTLQELGNLIPPPLDLQICSTIPLGRGLGSGAAVSTAIVRALTRFFEKELPPDTVSKLVYEVEKIHHGTPSGIDNTVVAFEQPVYFKRRVGVSNLIRRLNLKQRFTLVIGDTGIITPTHQVVGALRDRWRQDREHYEGYFDEIEMLVEQARMTLEHRAIDISALGKLMDENQAILTEIGISTPELDHLVRTAREAGAWGAKLSGAGGGGNMIALVFPEIAPKVKQALLEAGATAVIITEVAP